MQRHRNETSRVRASVMSDGALANTKLHDRLYRAAEEEEESGYTFSALTRGRKPLYASKDFTARLTIDSPTHMTTAMAAAVPCIAPRAGTTSSAYHGLSTRMRRHGGNTAGGDTTSAYAAAQKANATPYIGKLQSSLDEAARRKNRRDKAAAPPGATHNRHSQREAALSEVPQASPLNVKVKETPSPATTMQMFTREWVSERDTETGGARGSAAPTLRAGTPSAPPQSAKRAHLLTALSTGRFPVPNVGGRPADRSWFASQKDVAVSGQCGNVKSQRTANDVDAQGPSTLITEVSLTARNSPEADLNVSSASSSMESSETHSENEVGGLSQALLNRLHAEPIRSYRVLRDATTRPASALLPRTAAQRRSLVGSGKIAEENLARSHHMFEHARYASQAELLTFLDWRKSCRAAVCQSSSLQRCSTGTGDVTYERSRETAASSILDTLGRSTGSHSRRASQPVNYASSVSRIDRSRTPVTRPRLDSAWTRSAAVLATEQQRECICAKLEMFSLDFAAAAMSRDAMDALRRDVIAGVRSVPAPDIFTKQRLRAYLRSRVRHSASTIAQDDETLAAMTDTDLMDAMPSRAESAFVEFALKVLP